MIKNKIYSKNKSSFIIQMYLKNFYLKYGGGNYAYGKFRKQ